MTPVQVLDLLREGEFTRIHDLFAPSLRTLIPAEAIQTAWTTMLTEYGSLTDVGQSTTEGTVTRIPLTFERGRQTLILTMNDAGQLGGLQLAPASAAAPVGPWTEPSYVDTSLFDERAVTIGSSSLAVPGTLSVPRRPGPFPVVILLSGSGAHDRDETIGRNKPFKDLAWGLASRGVGVLRFDKVTHAHPAESAKKPDFTIADEYVPAALDAVRLLRGREALHDHEEIDRIHLLGHSLGGTVVPRIAAAEPAIAGVILWAAGAQPFHRAVLRQFRYLASLDEKTSAISEKTLEPLTKQVERVDSPDLAPDTPATELPFGIPAPYWLDLRADDPPATAATLDMPIFIAQGARDYQVTVTDDLALWQTALADRPDVTIRVYDADNHLFFPGTGPSTPAEYEPAQHVDPEVVADIAGWLTAEEHVRHEAEA